MWHTYYTPTTLNETLRLLAQHGKDARIIAGGTDILIELERKIRTPGVLIDITHIPGLDQIRLEKNVFHLGPLVTHNQVVASKAIVERAYPLARACWDIGAPQIRNRGTIAGNVITASPANDTIAPLWALGASVTLRSVRGERALPFYEFYKGMRKTAMADDEMLTDISFSAMNDEERGAFIKLGLRRAQAISVVNAAVILELHRDAIVKAHLTYGSVAPTIVRAPEVEKYLIGKSLTDEVIKQAGELARGAARPIDDVRGPADYRVEMMPIIPINPCCCGARRTGTSQPGRSHS
jgi:CO/xanthine dehydrogenase FAD-binding subunit